VHVVEDVRECIPDIVIMDIDIPGSKGYDAVKMIKQFFPEMDIIMFTVFDDADSIFKSLQNGAVGYLLKNTNPQQMIEAIQEVKRGGSPITPSIARKVVAYFSQQHQTQKPSINLSPREIQLLNALVHGSSYAKIASDFMISIDTVRSHIRNIYEKLQVNSKTQAIFKARNENII
jgi:DNA-binding NarL/FixJ family response regulator